MKKISLMSVFLMFGSVSAWSQEPVAAEAESTAAPTVVVVLPEKIGEETYLLAGRDNEPHLVQAEIEKQLVRKGLEVVEVGALDPQIEGGLSWQTLTVKQGALTVARQAEADYLVYGQATAVRAGTGTAYGVTSTRAQATITARLVRVSDGKILEIFDGEALEGDQAFGIAAKRALKTAAKPVAEQVAAACEKVMSSVE